MLRSFICGQPAYTPAVVAALALAIEAAIGISGAIAPECVSIRLLSIVVLGGLSLAAMYYFLGQVPVR